MNITKSIEYVTTATDAYIKVSYCGNGHILDPALNNFKESFSYLCEKDDVDQRYAANVVTINKEYLIREEDPNTLKVIIKFYINSKDFYAFNEYVKKSRKSNEYEIFQKVINNFTCAISSMDDLINFRAIIDNLYA